MFGYTHKFKVAVNGTEVLFRPVEERNYRAIVEPEQLEMSKIEVDLLVVIAAAIEAILK